MPRITLNIPQEIADAICTHYKYNDKDRYIDTVRGTSLDTGGYMERLESQTEETFVPEETKEDFTRRMLIEHIRSVYKGVKQYEAVTVAKESVEDSIRNISIT